MNKNVMERIFDPYFTTKEPGKGTGLGLSVVHGIVRHHSGHIAVYSEPGKGTVFHIYLPLIEKRSSKLEIQNSHDSVPKGNERILLVDDEEEIVIMEKLLLEKLGYHVTGLTGSKKAIDVFRSEPENFDLVITDMTMPQMTGMELSGEFLSIRPDIPIILCTGFSEFISEDQRNRYL